mmetsp:Transcript_13587/g.29835  ORF Transcript_13587/g.29835 Transcript_13587/m.29835 type:complete len:94 (-) Transcript_13587:49-330(-)
MRSDAELKWQLRLPRGDSQQKQELVSCACAICLNTYKVDESVCWAATSCDCQHVNYANTSNDSGNSSVVPCLFAASPSSEYQAFPIILYPAWY